MGHNRAGQRKGYHIRGSRPGPSNSGRERAKGVGMKCNADRDVVENTADRKEILFMEKSEYIQFYEKYLCEVSRGRGYREHENPACEFSKDAKAGKYNDLSDEEYGVLLRKAEELSAIWLDTTKQTAADILKTALENIDIDRESLHRMAEILSECHIATGDAYQWGKIIPKPEGAGENRVPEASSAGESDEGSREPFWDDMVWNSDEIIDERWFSPREIYKWLEEHIYGQKEAVRAAAMLIFNHMHGRKRNVLFVGPTGCGKTEIWRACSTVFPNIRIIDSNVISQEGWSGSFKLSNIFDGMSQQDAEHSIIVFDEFDKLCEPKIGSGGTNHSLGLQNELLKPIEGGQVHLKKYDVDTSEISFVFCGSFERLMEMKTERTQAIGFGAGAKKEATHFMYENTIQPADLVRYAGMRQEIAGRIQQIVQLSPMTAEDYRAILKDRHISPLRQLERQYEIKLHLDKCMEEKLAQEAEETRMGVRYLRSRIQQMLDEQMFQNYDQKEYTLGA